MSDLKIDASHFNTIVKGVLVAQSRGAYTLDEASVLFEAFNAMGLVKKKEVGEVEKTIELPEIREVLKPSPSESKNTTTDTEL